MNRYARQISFAPIGVEGQDRLKQSKVAVVGLGALGSVIAETLTRAGVGYIRIIDRDYVELVNLQRQVLYTEQDAKERKPKAIAAKQHVMEINSEVVVEEKVTDVNSMNVEKLIQDMDLVMDGTDNFFTRHLINEACHKHQIPWIYAGALGSKGSTLNVTWKEDTPCLRCFVGSDVSTQTSCSTDGVLGMLTQTMASIECAEAIKILVGAEDIRLGLLHVDVWKNRFQQVAITQDPACPVCGIHTSYEFLGKATKGYTTRMCGYDATQVVPEFEMELDLQKLEERLLGVGEVHNFGFSLQLKVDEYDITVFPDGRAIIKHAIDANHAKSLYTEYIQ